MAKYTFSVESDDLHEVASVIASAAGAVDPVMEEIKETPAAKAAPKKTRVAEATKPAVVEEIAVEVEHPMLQTASLSGVMEKASEVLGKGGSTGAEMMLRLKEGFGVESFSALKTDDYDRCLAMLDEL